MKARFFIQCDVMFLVRLHWEFEIVSLLGLKGLTHLSLFRSLEARAEAVQQGNKEGGEK